MNSCFWLIVGILALDAVLCAICSAFSLRQSCINCMLPDSCPIAIVVQQDHRWGGIMMVDQEHQENSTGAEAECPEASVRLEEAKKRVRSAAVAAIISASITAIFGFLGFFVDGVDGRVGELLDPWVLFDAFLIGMLAYFVFREAFVATVLLVIYWIINLVAAGVSGLSILSFVFLYYFVNGVRGAWHIRQCSQRPARSVLRRIFVWGAGGVAAVFFLALVIVGGLIEARILPDTMVIDGSELPEGTIETLTDHKILMGGEEILMVYSLGIFSWLEDGNMLTDRHVISWWQDENGDLQLERMAYLDIQEATLTLPEDDYSDSVIEVTSHDDDYIMLYVSAEEGGDQRFLRALKSRMIQVTSESPVPQVGAP